MEAIDKLLVGEDLLVKESERIFSALLSQTNRNADSGKLLLLLLRKKGESAAEIAGLVHAIRKMEKNKWSGQFPNAVDGCGTGGDGTHSFNISTLASLVAAGAGACVAKHGNRSISSRCGSADLLESLGVKIDASPRQMLQALATCGIGYFHAPLYHPVFQKVQMLRKDLARRYQARTIFNLIGPLVNPLRPNRQAIGVFQKELVRVIAETARKLKYDRALIFWSFDGTDELSTTAPSLVIEVDHGKITKMIKNPKQLGFESGKSRDLRGGEPSHNARIALRLLRGDAPTKSMRTKRDAIILNAAAILYVSKTVHHFKEGIRQSRKSLESGQALGVLKELIRISHGT